ncbi:hypothetical protein JCM19238_5081 [Vibrio ponticus]|nr:hypothetical protein JCM19238_5081 [Vibrio ponticus]
MLGGEQPNFNFADALLDMILHENAHVELNPKRIGEWMNRHFWVTQWRPQPMTFSLSLVKWTS